MVIGEHRARSRTARVLAPVVFLVAVTIAALLIREGMGDRGEPVSTPPPLTAAAVGPRYHEVVRGDTLADLAARYGTTVAELRRLNPEIDPVSLRVGLRLRVR